MKTKTHYVADHMLNSIARRLYDLKWQHLLTADELAHSEEIQKNPDSPKHLLAVMSDYNTMAVRMYLGGAQRTFGFFKGADITSALRFADMVKMFFWKYKVRQAHEPTGIELNFSADRANSDLVAEPAALRMLQDIELHLQKTGVLVSAEEKEKRRKAGVADKGHQRTVSGMIVQLGDVLAARIDCLDQEWDRRLTKLEESMRRLHTPSAAPGYSPLVVISSSSPLSIPSIGDPLPAKSEPVCAKPVSVSAAVPVCGKTFS